jgi:hypothetical protein
MRRSRFHETLFGRPALIPRLIEFFIDEAIAAAEAERSRRRARLKRDISTRWRALPPGPDTPLWNELVRQVQPYLGRWGSKSQLARLLGVPRQRLQACFKAKYACLDAERTLQLLGWLGFLQRGGQLVPLVIPGRRSPGPARRKVPGAL